MEDIVQAKSSLHRRAGMASPSASCPALWALCVVRPGFEPPQWLSERIRGGLGRREVTFALLVDAPRLGKRRTTHFCAIPTDVEHGATEAVLSPPLERRRG